MLVLFVLLFYHLDKTDKIHRLIHDSGLVTNLMYVLKLFQVTAGNVHSFRICSKETLRIMYPKYPVLDMIQRIHLRCGSFRSVIRFWISVKKRNILFRIENPDLDLSKEINAPSMLMFMVTMTMIMMMTTTTTTMMMMMIMMMMPGVPRAMRIYQDRSEPCIQY